MKKEVPPERGRDDWMDEFRKETEIQKVLSLWKGKRFLKRLQKSCSEKGTGKTTDRADEGMGR